MSLMSYENTRSTHSSHRGAKETPDWPEENGQPRENTDWTGVESINNRK
jgi:hypothetical protein